MDFELTGRTCLVTGASAGIGPGVVQLLVRQGVKVVATARRVENIERLGASLATEGYTRPAAIAGDITDAAAVADIAAASTAALGQVDILVVCATRRIECRVERDARRSVFGLVPHNAFVALAAIENSEDKDFRPLHLKHDGRSTFEAYRPETRFKSLT
ncbi:SDR family NAD(P)-dependent oxidoreductase [Reyranella sp.]|uniref:SDR family NAD(P)-dependent oxidoreductase n=1 Tax=Reyranella sp. TaxID=1929291 RepID=UPI00378309A9